MIIPYRYKSSLLSESEIVIGRMTNPSSAVQFAITEYVTDEQATLYDNWIKTDDVLMMMSDQDVNAKTFWKVGYVTTTRGVVSFILYGGMDFGTGGGNLLRTDWIIGNLQKFAFGDAYTSTSTIYVDGIGNGTVKSIFGWNLENRNYQYVRNNGQYVYDRSYALFQGSAASQTIQPPDHYHDSITTFLKRNGGIQQWLDNTLVYNNTVGGFTLNNNSSLLIGGHPSESTSWGYRGILSHIAFGGGVGFDRVAHDNHVQKYRDRMTIAKYRTEVDVVLAQYTGLTVPEILATERLVARSIKNGNWAHIISVFLVFYIPGNAAIDLQVTPGDGVLPSPSEWIIDKNIADNEIIVGESDSYNWNIAQLYDYSNTNLLADQTETLIKNILENSITMLGRTLNISDNNGVTLKTQNNLDLLIIDGWTIFQ